MFSVGAVDLPAPRAWPSASPTAATDAAAPADGEDAFDLADEYGTEAAARLSAILRELERAGFAKARDASWSAFDRVLSALAWLLHRIVAREDAAQGRVQWDVLRQRHVAMRPRLGFAQEVVRCVEALPFGGCPVAIQPHQLLLQDFGDIGTVHRLVSWLIEQAREPAHLVAIQQSRAYLDVVDADRRARRELASYAPLGRDVAYLQRAFGPRRRWRYVAGGSADEAEDALVQRCLFEYGERVTAVAEAEDEDAESGDSASAPADAVDLMAQIASQVAARAAAVAAGEAAPKKRTASAGTRRLGSLRMVDADFDKQYEKVRRQAMKEQQELLARQREREAQLLQQVVSVPEDPADASSAEERDRGRDSLLLEQLRKEMQSHEMLVEALIQEKRGVDAEMDAVRTQAEALDEAMASLQLELEQTNDAIQQNHDAAPFVGKLRELLLRHEALKVQKDAYRAECRGELGQLQQRILQLKQRAMRDTTTEEEDMARLQHIEAKHGKMKARYMELKRAVASQTREVLLKMKQIDEIPTRIELIQYEKRFVELYDQVALTLDETRKYYCVYNTLKTTHEFLEKEISLINSIYDNFDVAMSTKTAADAFFSQVDAIVKNIQSTLAKQEAQRKAHQLEMETLDSKYQVLLERERTYVSAVRDFQRECEKNDRLAARVQASTTASSPGGRQKAPRES